jgi:hypothetical protein
MPRLSLTRVFFLLATLAALVGPIDSDAGLSYCVKPSGIGIREALYEDLSPLFKQLDRTATATKPFLVLALVPKSVGQEPTYRRTQIAELLKLDNVRSDLQDVKAQLHEKSLPIPSDEYIVERRFHTADVPESLYLYSSSAEALSGVSALAAPSGLVVEGDRETISALTSTEAMEGPIADLWKKFVASKPGVVVTIGFDLPASARRALKPDTAVFFFGSYATATGDGLQTVAKWQAARLNATTVPPATASQGTSALKAYRARTPQEAGIDEIFALDLRTGTAEADQQFLNHLTRHLGAGTRSASEAYMALVLQADGTAVAATNYSDGLPSGRPMIRLAQEDLTDADRFAKIFAQLMGSTTTGGSVKLKILLNGEGSNGSTFGLYDKANQSLPINTRLFSNAELYVANDANVYTLQRIDRPAPPPRWASKLNQCCVFTGVPPNLDSWSRLSRYPFDRAQTHVVSLFSDSKFNDSIRSKKNYTAVDRLGDSPLSSLATIFASGPRGSAVVLVGHVEGAGFVIEGTPRFLVPFDQLTELARSTGRPMILLGCYTAEHIASERGSPDVAVGALNLLYPREIVEALDQALRQATTMGEFTERLSSDNVYLWLSSNFMRDVDGGSAKTLRAPVYKRLADNTRSIVGSIFMYLPCFVTGACG